eukprot:scaffold2429_cov52-Phaeocystis_antarctica.AAC.2
MVGRGWGHTQALARLRMQPLAPVLHVEGVLGGVRRHRCSEVLQLELTLGEEERDGHGRLVHWPHLALLGHIPAAAHLTRLAAARLACLRSRTPLAPAAATAAAAGEGGVQGGVMRGEASLA